MDEIYKKKSLQTQMFDFIKENLSINTNESVWDYDDRFNRNKAITKLLLTNPDTGEIVELGRVTI